MERSIKYTNGKVRWTEIGGRINIVGSSSNFANSLILSANSKKSGIKIKSGENKDENGNENGNGNENEAYFYGPPGPQGLNGELGPDGSEGSPGLDGSDSIIGATGPKGPLPINTDNIELKLGQYPISVGTQFINYGYNNIYLGVKDGSRYDDRFYRDNIIIGNVQNFQSDNIIINAISNGTGSSDIQVSNSVYIGNSRQINYPLENTRDSTIIGNFANIVNGNSSTIISYIPLGLGGDYNTNISVGIGGVYDNTSLSGTVHMGANEILINGKCDNSCLLGGIIGTDGYQSVSITSSINNINSPNCIVLGAKSTIVSPNCTGSIIFNNSIDDFTVSVPGFYCTTISDRFNTNPYMCLMYNNGEIFSEPDGFNSKTFVIDHPDNNFEGKNYIDCVDHTGEKFLVHSCLEGPEGGIYYRGVSYIPSISSSSIEKGNCKIIEIPSYINKIGRNFTCYANVIDIDDGINNEMENGLNIELSSIYKDGQLIVSLIYMDEDIKIERDIPFCWLLIGERVEINVEVLKKDVALNGNGSYKWISEFES